MAYLTVILFQLIFEGSMKLASRLSKTSPALYALGEKILNSKENQLKYAPLIRPVRQYRESASKTKLRFFLFPLILIKSIAFFFISLFQIAPVLLIFQGLSMGSMVRVMKDKGARTWQLNQVIRWQLLSHVSAAAMGTWLGFYWLIEKIPIDWPWLLTIDALVLAGISLVTAFIAAFKEAGMILEDHN